MKIEELVAGRNDSDEIALDGVAVPVSALKELMNEGYAEIKPYPSEGTFSVWGKTATACLTRDQIRKRLP